MCRSTGTLQVLHLGTCYFLRGYPGRPKTLHPRGPLVKRNLPHFFCEATGARRFTYCSATTSISTRASLGNAATAMEEREGGAFVKKCP